MLRVQSVTWAAMVDCSCGRWRLVLSCSSVPLCHPVDSRIRGNDGRGCMVMSLLLFRQVMCACSLSVWCMSDQSNG